MNKYKEHKTGKRFSVLIAKQRNIGHRKAIMYCAKKAEKMKRIRILELNSLWLF